MEEKKIKSKRNMSLAKAVARVCMNVALIGVMLIYESVSSPLMVKAQRINSVETFFTERQTVELKLNERNDVDNAAFHVSNMFPGDIVTGDYCVKVSYEDAVTLKFRVDIEEAYDKLAEVLKCKVVLSDTGEVLHDGLMKDVPDVLEQALPYAEKGEEELLYQITAYLDASVGNEYQNTSLEADFVWWIEAEEKADSDTDDEGDDVCSTDGNKDAADITTPGTGDDTNMIMWLVLAVCAAAACIVLIIVKKRKEGRYDEQ